MRNGKGCSTSNSSKDSADKATSDRVVCKGSSLSIVAVHIYLTIYYIYKYIHKYMHIELANQSSAQTGKWQNNECTKARILHIYSTTLVPADIHAFIYEYKLMYLPFLQFPFNHQCLLRCSRSISVCLCVQVLELPALSADTIRFQLSAVEWFGGLLAN